MTVVVRGHLSRKRLGIGFPQQLVQRQQRCGRSLGVSIVEAVEIAQMAFAKTMLFGHCDGVR